jgi:pyruvate,water dikinase
MAQGYSQHVITGHVYNAVTGHRVINASIQWNDQATIFSDHSGNFHFITDTLLSQPISFNGNVLLWNTVDPVHLRIHSLGGKLLFSQTIVDQSSTQLPNLSPGLFLLTVETGSTISRFKVLAKSDKTLSIDKNSIYYVDQNEINYNSDSLRISKNGFLTRTIPIPKIIDHETIGLLPEHLANAPYLLEIRDPAVFQIFGSAPSRSSRGDVQEIKFVYDIKEKKIYYMNSKRWSLHLEFAVQVLGYKGGHQLFNATQYTNNKNRDYILGSINHYQGNNRYVIHYVAATELSCQQIETVYEQIKKTFIDESDISFFPLNNEWKECISVPQITSEELYEGQLYQGLNLGETFGYLRKESVENIEGSFFSRRDLILTDGIPNDLPVVAGIITSIHQTPLSHINVLSHSRNTPNMSLLEAFDNDTINSLLDQLVYLSVKEHTFEIRTATIEEAEAFWATTEPQVPVVLALDTTFAELIDINTANLADIQMIGGKAANFAEIVNISGVEIPTPENAFAIPLYYYWQHIKRHGIDTMISNALMEERFARDISYRKDQLIRIQEVIRNSAIDPELVNAVSARINYFSDFEAYRFRSSTNAEDLEFFSGAGLYNSHSAKKDHETKTIDNAIRKVWASLWNWRAFEEREYFKIDHLSCAMGILVHRSFPDEDANGVLITKNLYNQNPGFIINVQYGEESIVFPEPGIIHDQIILFTWSIDPAEEFMIEYLSYSNVPQLNGQTVMTNEEIELLGRYAKAIKRHYYLNTPHSCDCIYDDFGVDIEFKVDSKVSSRKIYIKQARLYR